jgi:hypothetical protein
VRLHRSDFIGLVICVLCLGWAFLVALKLQPNMAAMFADLGSASLPPLTRVFMRRWLPLMLVAIPVVATAVCIRLDVSAPTRAIVYVVTGVFFLLEVTLFLVAMYLPMLELAGTVR